METKITLILYVIHTFLDIASVFYHAPTSDREIENLTYDLSSSSIYNQAYHTIEKYFLSVYTYNVSREIIINHFSVIKLQAFSRYFRKYTGDFRYTYFYRSNRFI